MKAKHFCDKCIIVPLKTQCQSCLNNIPEYFGEAHEGLY